VDRVIEVVVGVGALNAQRNDYLNAISAALASTDSLAELIPQPHSDATLRAYLAALEKRLRRRTS
jgi:hypothetical protein